MTGVPMKGEPVLPAMSLQGHDVFAFAVRSLAKVATDLCEQKGLETEALDRVFAHQANARIIEATARRMKLPLEKFWLNLETTANTSAASIPISLDQAVRSGKLTDGMKIVMVGFGAGLDDGGSELLGNVVLGSAQNDVYALEGAVAGFLNGHVLALEFQGLSGRANNPR